MIQYTSGVEERIEVKQEQDLIQTNSSQPSVDYKLPFYHFSNIDSIQKHKVQHPQTKNILTNIGTCVKYFLRRHSRYGNIFSKEKAYLEFIKCHSKTRQSYTKLFRQASPLMYQVLGQFFRSEIIYFTLMGRYSFKQKINYVKYMESLLIAYEKKALKNIRLY